MMRGAWCEIRFFLKIHRMSLFEIFTCTLKSENESSLQKFALILPMIKTLFEMNRYQLQETKWNFTVVHMNSLSYLGLQGNIRITSI